MLQPVIKAGLIFCMLYSFPVTAGERLVLTCEDAVRIALGGSYTIQSNTARKKAHEYNYEYYKAMFRPRIDLSAFAPSLNESVSPIQRTDGLPVYNSTGLMQVGGRLKFTYILPTGGNFALSSQLYRENLKTVLALKNYEELKSKQANSALSLSFIQPIFTDNTLKENLEAARLEYEKSSSRFTREQVSIVYDVTRSFYHLYRVTRELEIARESLENSRQAFTIAKLKYEAGRIPEGDLLITEVEMSRNQAFLLESEGNLEEEKEYFKQLIGLDGDTDIHIATDLGYSTFDIEMESAVGRALENRREIREHELDVERQEIEIKRAHRYAEFKGEISAYYDITGVSTVESGSTGRLFRSSFDNFVDRPPNRGVTLTFSYPVFDWGRGASKVAEANVTLKERKLDLENLRRTIERETRDIVRTVRESHARLTIHEKNQRVMQRSYDISRLRFENGDMTSQELGREQERLAASQLQFLEAYITYQLAVADLTRKTLWDYRNDKPYIIDRKPEE